MKKYNQDILPRWQSVVSVNVEKLVREGHLRREAADGDRRKTLLEPFLRRSI